MIGNELDVLEVPEILLSNLNRSESNAGETDVAADELLVTEASTNQSNDADTPTESNVTNSDLSNTINTPPNNDDISNGAATIAQIPPTISTTSTTHIQSENDTVASPATVEEHHNDNINVSVLESSQPIVNSQARAESTSTLTTSSTTVHPSTEHSTPATTSTTPSVAEIILDEIESISKSPEPDNYIYETFSSVPPVAVISGTAVAESDTVAELPNLPVHVVSAPATNWPDLPMNVVSSPASTRQEPTLDVSAPAAAAWSDATSGVSDPVIVSDSVDNRPDLPESVVSETADIVPDNEPAPAASAIDDVVASTNEHLANAEEPPEAIAVAIAA